MKFHKFKEGQKVTIIASQEEFASIGITNQVAYEKLNGRTFKVVPNGYYSANIPSHGAQYEGQPLYTIIEEGELFFYSLPECMLFDMAGTGWAFERSSSA
jgi:hypothetical protein